MSLADDLQKLDQLKASGALSDEEFQQAKKKLLAPMAEPPRQPVPQEVQDHPGNAARRDVSYQIVMGLIVLIIFLLFMLALFHHHFSPGREFFHWDRY